MLAALGLARRGLGNAWPNPAVGCLLVQEGRVVARGWTQPGGRPHAESEALRRAGALARGATAYVSLEPCSHHGRTPPCCDALVDAGVRRAVIAAIDPDPRVSGSGIERLKAAGIEVSVGTCEAEARELNAGFFMRMTAGRPLLTLKTATSLDGRIATSTGESKWITGDVALALNHRLRSEFDAIVIGIDTALADDPQMTCRLPGLSRRSPVRIVMDSRLRLPPDSFLAQSAKTVPTWVVVTAGVPHRTSPKVFADLGVTVIEAPADGNGRPDLAWVAQELGQRGLTRVLIEAGGRLTGAWLRTGLIDRLAWFRAPKVLGGDGIPVTEAIGVASLAQAPRFVRMESGEVGADLIEFYKRPD